MFLAHATHYPFELPQDLDLLKSLGLDGIECYYPTYTQEEMLYYDTYCKNNNMLISAGSDFHGESRRKNKLATGLNNNICKNRELIKNWESKF